MYARVTNFQVEASRLDEALEVTNSSIIPVMKQQQGFKGVLTLVDRQAGKATSVTLWETEADMKAGESSGYYQQQVGKLSSFITAPPTREVYEATVDL
jgi:heme-degrading monooxygenase HmoA